MFSPTILVAASEVITLAQAKNLHLFAAESCTGGLIAAALTAIPGASSVMLGGVVAYANDVKMELLGVPEALILQHGAVSEEVARAMAQGAVMAARHCVAPQAAVLAVAITGIAGPGGGSIQKPVGTLHLATDGYPDGYMRHSRIQAQGDRDGIRSQAVEHALRLLKETLEQR